MKTLSSSSHPQPRRQDVYLSANVSAGTDMSKVDICSEHGKSSSQSVLNLLQFNVKCHI